MNVYDFDGTIYAGDSTVDFWLYCVKKHPSVLKSLPGTLRNLPRYLTGRVDLEYFKESFYGFLRFVPDVQKEVVSFWDSHTDKLQKWYLERKNTSDVIISASPEFLLRECCTRLGVRLIASAVDSKTGRLQGSNCKGKEKVRRFRDAYANAAIENFYSDSHSDKPLADLAEHSYFVNGKALTETDF